ncbi:hypothetical protein PR202_gb12640 [Eleusine coracana subsp. coracana]|uniref:Uncharacterized protein n=1 Tax=Eleusine coracana subsp. coracana TaxID=191504 RepID=A0AAV5ENA0_ELECO|nr:hypothetical protein PR202_gb12640 [Eleusine coracana subsp. coracana]
MATPQETLDPELSPLLAQAPTPGGQLEDPKPSASPAAGAQLEDPKPSASPAAGAQLEDPKPSAAVVSPSAAAKRPWLRPMIKLASWPVQCVLHGMDHACDVLVVASRQPVVVRCVAKMFALVPDRVRGAVSRVLQLFGSPSPNSRGLPISDPAFERLYFELDMERVRVVVLAVVAAGIILFITLEVLVIAGFVTRYQYVGILRKFVGFLQSLLKAVSKISGFYNNVMWHCAEAARMLQKAAEQKLKVPTPTAKQQLPPPATEQQLPPPAIEQQLLHPTIELLIPTPPPPAMDMC